jgi:PAS domain S-box-containing protein
MAGPTPENNIRQAGPKLLKLRRLADAACQDSPVAIEGIHQGLTSQASAALIHDLRVHQIELEMQNLELCRTSEALDKSRERYFDLYNLAPTGFCTVSEKGLILESNLAAANLLGVPRRALIKQLLSQFVVSDDQASYYKWKKQVIQDGRSHTCELRMKSSTDSRFWGMLNATASSLPGDNLTLRVVLSDITERKNFEAALEDAQLQLSNFALRQQDEFDELRMELAHDVHDQLGQNLAGLKLEVDIIRDIAPACAERMQMLILQAVSSIRDISRALRPIALELGLIHALHAMVDEVSTGGGAEVRINLPKGLPSMSGQVERGLYRIAQEALTNAVLHAHARAVQVSLRLMGNRLELEVLDDGQGFEVEALSASCGLGLTGMRERARLLGAKFFLKSTLSHGTRITVDLPIATPERT